MLLSKNVQVYVKTTETCNLNCSHCFTSGSQGAKIFFNPQKTTAFLEQVIQERGIQSLRLLYHGGEPLLAPLKDLFLFYDLTQSFKDKYGVDVSYGLQTNLVYKLTNERLEFLDLIGKEYGMGTSWDKDIRFGPHTKDNKKLQLWENNVRILADRGFEMTLMICLTKNVIENHSAQELQDYAEELGFKFILFERLTADGNANEHPEIFPNNKDLDQWMFQMFKDKVEKGSNSQIHNMLLAEIIRAASTYQHIGNRCRNCEQSLMTINADGTIAGCPNSAPTQSWGSIDTSLDSFLKNKERIGAICKEKVRNPNCLTCEVNTICNGDCYKLPWQDNICAAPKTLMKYLKQNNSRDFEHLTKLRELNSSV